MTTEWTLPLTPFPAKSRLVVGVSGGADSMGLLYLLLEQLPQSPKRLIVAHVNYGLRGKSSDRDEALVRNVCRKNNIPFKKLKVGDFKTVVQREGRSLQELAREIRYAYFQKISQAEKAWGAVVAHHLEDQAETVLERLLRGAGSRGLSGLRPIQTLVFDPKFKPLKIWRPLLGFSKVQIHYYLKSNNILWREDRSNGGNKYLRNQIRNDVLPYLSRWNPNLVEGLARLGEITASEDALMEKLLGPLGSRLKSQWKGKTYLCSTQAFETIPLAFQRRWIRRVAEKLNPRARGLPFERVEELIGLWKGRLQGPRDLGFGLSGGRQGRLAYLRQKG